MNAVSYDGVLGYGVATISRLLKIYVSFAKEHCKSDIYSPKRPVILRSLRIVATPYAPFPSSFLVPLEDDGSSWDFLVIIACDGLLLFIFGYISSSRNRVARTLVLLFLETVSSFSFWWLFDDLSGGDSFVIVASNSFLFGWFLCWVVLLCIMACDLFVFDFWCSNCILGWMERRGHCWYQQCRDGALEVDHCVIWYHLAIERYAQSQSSLAMARDDIISRQGLGCWYQQCPRHHLAMVPRMLTIAIHGITSRVREICYHLLRWREMISSRDSALDVDINSVLATISRWCLECWPLRDMISSIAIVPWRCLQGYLQILISTVSSPPSRDGASNVDHCEIWYHLSRSCLGGACKDIFKYWYQQCPRHHLAMVPWICPPPPLLISLAG